MSPYCPHCGGEVEHAVETAGPAEEVVSAEVEIARINAERDVKVAQIAARQDKDWNETRLEETKVEAEAEVASAEATAEVVGEIIAAEAGAGDGQEDGEPPVVVEVTEPEGDPEPVAPAPPQLAEPTEPETKKAPGWWDAYR